jgi:hypothetical protein
VPVTYTARENVPLNVPAAQGVLASDTDSAGDTLTATLQTTVAHGTLTLNSNGSFIYTPPASFTGTVDFIYVPHGTYTAGSPTTVTIVVGQGAGAPPPPPPGSGHLAPPPPGLPDPPAGGSAGASQPAVASDTVDAASGSAGSGNAVSANVPSANAASGSAASGGIASVTAVTRQAVVPTPVSPVLAPPPVVTAASRSPLASDSSPMVQPDVPDPGTYPSVDATGLLSVPDPIVLPDFVLPDFALPGFALPGFALPGFALTGFALTGDETYALMMPASPAIAQLPEAFALAGQRLASRPPSIITFVDPVTGEASGDTGSADQSGGADMAWLLFDPDNDASMSAVASQIRWDSPAP